MSGWTCASPGNWRERMASRSAKADPHSRSRTCVPCSICILQFTKMVQGREPGSTVGEVVRLAGAVGSEVAAGTPAERAPGALPVRLPSATASIGVIARKSVRRWDMTAIFFRHRRAVAGCPMWLRSVARTCGGMADFLPLRLRLPQHTHEPREQAEQERTTGGCGLAHLWVVALATRPATSASTLSAILVLWISPHPHTMAHLIAGGGPWYSDAC
jgi:hypothetical protein